MKQNLEMGRAERAQMAMMLEVCAYPKPGNVDRCHDYPDTRLEHFLASAIMVRPVFDEAEKTGGRVGRLIRDAVMRTNGHSGGTPISVRSSSSSPWFSAGISRGRGGLSPGRTSRTL